MSIFVTDTTAWEPRDGDVPHIQRLLRGEGLTLIRLSFREGQVLDEHRAPGPILISGVSGAIDLDVITGSQTTRHLLEPGTTLHLDTGVLHRLTARADSVVHLTLHRAAAPKPADPT
ncbi:hypothetical protein [Actinocorallia libanotica]|uniref:Quercetin dioxygenase-like cupin family protein n=1 Tax=Actinocorallia libanotica TaxID=46162 RepID=A0ABP4BZN2_9ACTN